MKRYEKYKDSGVEWIGEIPEGWEIKKIKHKCYVKARIGWKGLKSSEFLTNGYSYLITGTDFNNDKIDWTNCYHIDKDRYDEDPYIQLQNEDLLITKDGTIGKLAIVSGIEKPACLNSGVFVVRSLDKGFSTRYLFWVLKSNAFFQFNEYTSYGSTIQHLYQNVFVDFRFPFPSLNCQFAIVNYLDRKTAEIDKLISQKERLIELYEEEKTAIINQAVTKGIDPDVKLKDSGVEWLGEIPEGWDVKRLRYFTSYFKGNAFKSSDFRIEGIPIVKASNIKNKTIVNIDSFIGFDDQRDEFERVKLKEGDIVVSTVGSKPEVLASAVGQLASISGIFSGSYLNQNTVCIRPISCVEASFLKYAFFSKYMRAKFDAASLWIANQAYLEVESIRNIALPFPRSSEQTAIVNHIETETARIDAKITKTRRIIELQKEYRTALISEVVTGKIKITEEIIP